jgi:diketogulonate reductase-like aldo/keto reductase
MEMPSFGLGTYTVQAENCSNIIYSALEIGYRLFDTAELYKNHTDIAIGIKKAIENNIIDRNDIWLSSKIHNRDQRKLNIAQAIQKILLDLDTNYLDLIMLHSAQKTYSRAYAELLRCQNHYNIRYIGVSNFRQDELETIIDKTGVCPYINQIEISPFNQRLKLRSYMDKYKILPQAYASLVCGNAFDSKYLTQYSLQPHQLLLGWAKYYDLKPIPTAHTIEHLQSNYNDLKQINLDKHNIASLDLINEEICNYVQHADKLDLCHVKLS